MPYALLVRVTYERASVPQAVRDEVEFEIARALSEARCFATVAVPKTERAAEVDLVLEIGVARFTEETRYDLGVADHQSMDLPAETRNAAVTTVGADLTLRLLTLPDLAPIRSRSSRETAGYRPLLGEDAAAQARLKLLRNTARSAVRFGCKGNSKSLAKAIERARLEHGVRPDPER